jgi:hypothetical protein
MSLTIASAPEAASGESVRPPAFRPQLPGLWRQSHYRAKFRLQRAATSHRMDS